MDLKVHEFFYYFATRGLLVYGLVFATAMLMVTRNESNTLIYDFIIHQFIFGFIMSFADFYIIKNRI